MRVTKLLSGIFAVLLGFLLVGIAFAVPFDKSDGTLGHGLSSHLDSPGAVNDALALAQPPAKDCGDLGDTQPLKNVRALSDNSDPLSGWAGAKYDSSPSGHFTAIQGTFTIPKPVIPAGAPIDGSISNWTTMIAVWIGGEDPLLSTGVQLFAHLSGEVSFEAWFQGGVSAASDYKDMSISEGDSVTLRIEMYSHTSGIAIIDNITTGKRASQPMSTPSNPLPPPSDAAWIVAVPYDTDHSAPFANFDTVKFTDAVAFTSDARNFGPGDGAIANNIYHDSPNGGLNVTVTDIGDHEVTISYIQRQVESRGNDDLDIPLGSLPASISTTARIANVVSGALNDDIYKSANWAGAMIEEPPAHSFFTSVSGTFTIPGLAVPVNVAHADTYYVAIWVGIDGTHQGDALFQAGIQVTMNSATGTHSVVPWAEWLRAGPQYYNDLAVSVGDVITVHVETTSPTTGTVFIENKTTGQSINETINAPDGAAVTGHSVEWIVEDPVGSDGLHPFGDFGHVVFTDCKAVSDDGNPFGPEGAAEIEFYKGTPPEPLTNVETSETGLEITYKPPPGAASPIATRDSATKDYHYSSNWAGAWINPPASHPNTHFVGISGKFTVPKMTPGSFTPSGVDATADHDAAIWLGLDGQGGEPGFLQAGIAFTLSPTTGEITHSHAWTEWMPQGSLSFPAASIALSPGDVIALNLTATSALAGTVAIENETTGQRASRAVAAPDPAVPLRGRFAEWIVEHARPAAALADFATVAFTHCRALLSDGALVGLDAGVHRDLMADEAARVLYTDVVVDAANGSATVSYNPRRVDGPLVDVTTVVVDEHGEPVLVDASGRPVLDKDGRPVVVGGPRGGGDE